MNINNFEKHFEPKILSRGKSYFLDGNVLCVISVGSGEYEIEVEGSELYTVSVVMTGDSIDDISCDCPYDFGDHCKHQAAALFQLRKLLNEGSDIKSEKITVKHDLHSDLCKLSKEKLIDIILNKAKEDKAFENILKIECSEYNSADDIISAFTDAMKKSKVHGRYERYNYEYDSDEIIEIAETTIEKAESIEACCERVKVYISVIDVIDDVISSDEYLYDNDGWELLSPVNECVNRIQETSREVIENDDADEIERFWNILIESSREENEYYGGEDHWFRIMFPFCKFPKYCEELKKLQNLSNNTTHNIETSAQKYYSILKEFGTGEECEKFIADNIHFSFLRRIAIRNAIEREEYEKAERLAFEGEIQDQDKRYYGLVKEWRVFRYDIYKKLGETDKLRIVCHQLILGGDSEYYTEWKNLIDESKFHNEVENLLGKADNSVYKYIITKENMTEKIYDYCLKNSYNIVNMYSYLKNTEFEELGREIYEAYIYARADQASDRSRYADVCNIISEYKRECGERYSDPIISDLREKNRRRPAFIDELRKITK